MLGSVTDTVIRSSPVPTLVIGAKSARNYELEDEAISKVVVPLDGSRHAEAVLPYVEELAKTLSLEVILVRVIHTGGPYTGLSDDTQMLEVDPAIKAKAVAYLESMTENLRSKDLIVSWKLLEGSTSQKMIDFARETPQSLIALATRGHSGIERWLEGSVSEAVVRDSGDPVLVVPPRRAA